jgi:hypothetical protein
MSNPPGQGRRHATAELFKAIEDLITQLRDEQRHQVADYIARAWGPLHGCADGWAMFIEAVDSLNPSAMRDEGFEIRD